MIRRDISTPGSNQAWALISQVEHARLAAELARHWQVPLVPTVADAESATRAHRELLAAVEHHDDGWAEWEAAPEIDPEHGRPRSFTEMPQTDSLAIWSKSIAVAEQIGPLAAWVVSRHFATLLQGSSGRGNRLDGNPPAAEWLELQTSRQEAWLQAWRSKAAGRADETAEYGLRALQFFDAASLWFCCVCPADGDPPDAGTSPSTLTFADGTEFQFSSSSGGSGMAAGHVASIHPWPLDSGDTRLSIDGRTAPVRRYETADDLLLAWQSHRLSWQLTAPAAQVPRPSRH